MLYHGRSIDPAADAAGGKCVCMHMHRGCAPAKQRSTQSQAAAKFPWYSEKIGLYFFPFFTLDMTIPYTGRDIALFVIAFFFPPLAVLIRRGCGIDFLINVCLTLLGAG